MAVSIPLSASGSRFSSFFKDTVSAKPANRDLKRGRILCVIYIFFPVIFSRASETEAASTWRNPSRRDASVPEGRTEPREAAVQASRLSNRIIGTLNGKDRRIPEGNKADRLVMASPGGANGCTVSLFVIRWTEFLASAQHCNTDAMW